METFKSALKDYFVYEGKDVMYLKNEKQRVRIACASENCSWLILTSWNSANGCFQVKILFNEHNCGRDFSSNLADRQWVTSKLVKRLLTQPDMKPKQATKYMVQDYNIKMSGKMISKALKAAREEVIGDEGAQYGKIRNYLMELHKTNPSLTAILDVIPQPESLPLFDRLYIVKEFFLKCTVEITRLELILKKEHAHAICMPCRHAVAAISKMGLRPEDFVHKWLTMEAVRATYSHCIKLVNSEEYWVQSNASKTLPPPIKRAAHRPKTKRRSDPVEKEVQKTGQNNSTANAEETTLDVAHATKFNTNSAPYFREKQPIVRPTAPIAQGSSRMSLQPTPSVGSGQSTSTNQGVSTAVSVETMAAVTSGTATRLFKFIPTPGIRPSNKN
ncbi:hypothetical protein Ahy_A06g027553 [Arachis hypogaea]|uniref:Uncharacterized protein n=1 Tax=Arachis hypogaea TaxID=3818 RepID=A0A445CP12_ARAHY|nr:hypothetical protein Ahy_A06g027553 [Arachis hypogaea]